MGISWLINSFDVLKNPSGWAPCCQSDLSRADIDRLYRIVGESDVQRFYPRAQERWSPSPTAKVVSDGYAL